MGRYITWEDVIDRYPELNTMGGADQQSSAYIVYAEAYVDGVLAPAYTPPFSSNNMVVRDLCIDMCFWRAARFKLDDAVQVKSAFFETVGLLKDGQIKMYDEAGNLIPQNESNIAWSNTMSYHTAFGMDAIEAWTIDENQADDDEAKR